MIVDTRGCIRRCLRRQGILDWGRVCVILNQNSSADRLELNPTGLTKREKHLKECQKSRSFKQIFFFKGNALLEQSSYGLCCPIGGRPLIEYLDSQEL